MRPLFPSLTRILVKNVLVAHPPLQEIGMCNPFERIADQDKPDNPGYLYSGKLYIFGDSTIEVVDCKGEYSVKETASKDGWEDRKTDTWEGF